MASLANENRLLSLFVSIWLNLTAGLDLFSVLGHNRSVFFILFHIIGKYLFQPGSNIALNLLTHLQTAVQTFFFDSRRSKTTKQK